jgi:hypothetical protein
MTYILKYKNQKGALLIYLIIIIAVFTMIMFPVTAIFSGKLQLLRTSIDREEALQIAEAGINYYQWHLAHFEKDYQDGTGQPGPYTHNYIDYDTQEVVGQFILTITPPLTGSSIVIVKSVGHTNRNPSITRTITARFGIPSLAKYAFLSNDVIWIGSNESVSGQVQSNNGIRFDGFGNAPIQSAKPTYMCPISQGSPCPTVKNGVWGSASQETQNFWQFPVPAIDFSSMTSDFPIMKSDAQSAGIYLPPSNRRGYSLVFNSDGTINIYKVKNRKNHPGNGTDTTGEIRTERTDYNERDFQYTANIPANGLIYIEDDVWVEGVVNGRVTVIAAKLPYNSSKAPIIFIPNDIVYNSKNGSDVLGLIAQRDVVVSYSAPNDLEINAAMIAQNGATQFFYYNGNIKDNITIYGSIMTFYQWTWTWINGSTVISGYRNTSSIYDGNLLYNPPPSFPVSSSGYQIISWTSD